MKKRILDEDLLSYEKNKNKKLRSKQLEIFTHH